MEKYKELFKNFIALLISNFGSKLLSFLLVPLYTSVLTTSDYGNYDLINITILLLIPILTISISDAVTRFLLEKDSNKKQIISISFRITFYGLAILILLAIVNYIFNIVNVINIYFVFFVLLYIVNVFYQLIQNIAKGFDKIKELAISGFLCSVLMVILNLVFLLGLKLGLVGYFLANIIAIGFSTLYLFVRLKIYKYINIKNVDKNIQKEMVNYSKPMIFNAIGWWINNASDRYIVTYFCGASENGIYSVGYKIPSILTSLQNIFNQAWTISAIQNYDDKEKNDYFEKIYSSYNTLMVLACSILIIFTKFIAKILYKNEFYLAWKYTPFLLISVVLGATSGIIGGIFAAEKNTKIISSTTMLGAIINTILNVVLVMIFGPIGATFSTMVAFLLVWIIRFIKMQKYLKLNINIIRDTFSYAILLLQGIIILIINNYYSYFINIALLILLIMINSTEIKDIIKKFYNKIWGNKNVKQS